MSSSNTPALQNHYKEQVIPALTKSRGYTNPHQVPSIVKVSINSGFGTDLDKNQIADVIKDLATIAGQMPVTAKARKSVANFKLRQGQVIGAHVTLRGETMWDFLYRLLSVALPTIRDFPGLPTRLDGTGQLHHRYFRLFHLPGNFRGKRETLPRVRYHDRHHRELRR